MIQFAQLLSGLLFINGCVGGDYFVIEEGIVDSNGRACKENKK